MSTTPKLPIDDEQMMPDQVRPHGEEATADDPNRGDEPQNTEAAQLPEELKAALMDLRVRLKMVHAPIRRMRVRKCLEAFEYLKNNCNISFDPDNYQFFDPIQSAGDESQDLNLYTYTNNIYQMLFFSFVAALSAGTPKTRYMPEDADSELDIATARRASTVMAMIERKNRIKSKLKVELMHLWTGGVYFSYSRYIVDAKRNGSTKRDIMGMVPKQVSDDHFVCPQCGADNAVHQEQPNPKCLQCGAPLSEEDFYPGQTMPVPVKVGSERDPNGNTVIDVFGLMNVDAPPFAESLEQASYLDLEVEAPVGAIRASYPEAWSRINVSGATSGSPDNESDRVNRLRKYSAGTSSGLMNDRMPTYSRCWFTPEAFNEIDDKDQADQLKELFPDGCKLVTFAGREFLEAVAEKLTDKWSWCPAVEGFGLYPMAVGDAALDIQKRINDVVNIIHEHMDREGNFTALYDADAIDGKALASKAMMPGSLTGVKRKGPLANRPLSDLIYKPELKLDERIYQYADSLPAMAQLVAGIRPEIWGGSDPHVETFGGQQQMLNQAIARLGLFYDNIREEHAKRSELAVRCTAENMDDQLRIVVEGDTESGFENEFVLLTELQGEFHAYPESDQGFPSTYGEVRDRLMQILKDLGDSPLAQAYMADPDNLRVISNYLLPEEIKLPGDSERTRVKRILAQLAKEPPIETIDQQTGAPVVLPSVQPDLDIDGDDGLQMIQQLAKDWLRKNYQQAMMNPQGFENVRAFLRLAAQKVQEKQIAQQLQQAAAAAPPGAPPPQGQQPQPGAPPQ